MNQEEINKRNEVIALFHGWKFIEAPMHKGDGYWNNPIWGKSLFHFDDFKYHLSWDWLMPVVEKIEEHGCIVEIWLSLGKGCRITKGNFKTPIKTIANTESNSTIEAVFLAVSDYCLNIKP